MSTPDNQELVSALARVADIRILVIGDIIVDHFIWGTVARISPEAPVPVVNVTHDNLLLGGSANVLNNIFALGGRADICGVIGNDDMGERLREMIAALPSSLDGVIAEDNRPTTIKTRIIAQSQQVVRFDRENCADVSPATLARVRDFIDTHLPQYQAVVVSDYAKGIITTDLMVHLRQRLLDLPGVPLVIDPKPQRPERFTGADIITPNHHEAEQLSGVAITDEASLLEAGNRLLDQMAAKAVLITRGEAGMSLFERGREMVTIPTGAREVFDVTGAGDTVIATLALGLAAGLCYLDAARLANYAAGLVVGKVGTATVSKEEIMEVLP